jgi:holo-[acyl-carrier protein] synthase
VKPAPVLFGVDVLDLRRVAGAVRRNGAVYTRHVVAADEHDLSTGDDISIAATVAVKESLVKAVGGRPSGFSWHDFVHRDGEPPAAVARLLTDAVPGIATAIGVELTESRTYAVRGASRAAVLHRSGAGDPGETSVVGAARWGRRHEVIVALAILVTISAKESS